MAGETRVSRAAASGAHGGGCALERADGGRDAREPCGRERRAGAGRAPHRDDDLRRAGESDDELVARGNAVGERLEIASSQIELDAIRPVAPVRGHGERRHARAGLDM